MIPLVVASERGLAQTVELVRRGCRTPLRLMRPKWKGVGKPTKEGDSPVHTGDIRQGYPEYHGAR